MAARSTPTVSDRYGLIVGSTVRSEADPRKLGDLATEQASFNGAVSSDGRRFAYWETAPGAGEARVLRLLDGSAPAQARVVFALPETETATVSAGGGVAWSSDGTGLLIGVNSREYGVTAPPVGAERPRYAALRDVDVASGSVREIARSELSLPLRPVAWDRVRRIAAAVEIGHGGYIGSYVLVREGAAPIRTQLGTDIAPAIAAPDASRVLAVRFRPSALYVWSLAEPARRMTMEPALGESIEKAIWRNAREIVVLIASDEPAAHRLEVWPLEGPRRVVLRGAQSLSGVRPDGTAAIVSGQVVDLETAAVSPIPGMTGVQHAHVASFLLR